MDANLYATFLRSYSEKRGIKRIEAKVTEVKQDPDSGDIKSLLLDSGEIVSGDLFIDCSGFRALLIEQTLNTGFDDWSHWLPCDRAVAVPSKSPDAPKPYSIATAREAGWQWRIPLQNRVGNGQVYCSNYLSDDQAASSLLDNIDGEALADVNFLKFKTGRRKKSWNKNCIAIGLSSGFLEPLESTSIFLIQIAIMKLIEFFPREKFDAPVTDEYNRLMAIEYDRIKDFLILHYHATERTDSDFWNYCRTMSIPDSLQHKMDLFRSQGHVERYNNGLFLEPSWVAVYLGQRVVPKHYHPGVDLENKDKLASYLDNMKQSYRQVVDAMPSHTDSIAKHCRTQSSSSQPWPQAAMSLYGVIS